MEVPHTSAIIEKPWRSILKTISWRATGTIDTMVISYLITGDIAVAGSIASIEVVSKMFLYYFHERIWGKLSIGREVAKQPDYEI